jgi:hypothetical protein
MIDNASILVFGLLVIYIVFRAIKLDKLIPWFSADTQRYQLPSRKNRSRSAPNSHSS